MSAWDDLGGRRREPADVVELDDVRRRRTAGGTVIDTPPPPPPPIPTWAKRAAATGIANCRQTLDRHRNAPTTERRR